MSALVVARSVKGLYLDYCSYEAAKYAVARWYYRAEMPVGKLVKVGVWEDGEFAGAVIFGGGSSQDLGTKYGLTGLQTCEMVRLALRSDHKASVSRVVTIALKLLRKACPGIRLVISFSDPQAGHVGGVYQAGNWIYLGKTAPDKRYLYRGEWHHSRNVVEIGFKKRPGGKTTPCLRPSQCERVELIPGKHRYAMPLDDATRARVKAFAQPYPKKDPEPTAVAPAAA